MSLIGLFKEKKKVRHTFSDEDRDNSTYTRALNKQMKELMKTLEMQNQITRLRMLQDELTAEPEESSNSMDTVMMTLLGGMLNKQGIPSTNAEQKPTEIEVTLTDEEIQNLIDEQVPKAYIKKIKKMDGPIIGKMIKAKFPNLSDVTIIRAIEMLKEQ